MHSVLFALTGCLALANAWLPGDKNLFGRSTSDASTGTSVGKKSRATKRTLPSSKIRGVNLGSLFVLEPWMAGTEWANMGCGSAESEFDCVNALGQDAANTAFQNHWATWITESDFATMVSYGLNTVRIPVGYWMDESIVYTDSEHFPQGGLPYLEQVCAWAAAYDIYVIIDLHGAPGAQVADNADTGQYASTPGFYQDYQYDRAYSFLENITTLIHTSSSFSTVGMLEVLNEPTSGYPTLVSDYYPNAYTSIRTVETNLGVSASSALHIQFMDSNWGAGDPNSALPSGYTSVAYDNHRYLKYDSSLTVSQSSYLSTSCSDGSSVASDGDTPLIVGEWSISPATAQQSDSDFEIADSANSEFYTQWWAAQVMAYEQQEGWIFWAWKAQLGDYRWSYQEAVEAGIIPTDPQDAYSEGAC